MKVIIDIDCTPEEARRFLGLPDLQPVHESYVNQLKTQLEEGLTPDAVARMVRSWGPLAEESLKAWSSILGQGRPGPA